MTSPGWKPIPPVAMTIHWDKTHTSPPILFWSMTEAENQAKAFRKIYRNAGLKYPAIDYKYTRPGQIILDWARSSVEEALDAD